VLDRRFPRRFLWLALLGWLAQVFVPVAHATAMADRSGLGHGWCSTHIPSAGSAVLAKKIAALPPDVRRIVLDDGTGADVRTDCAQMCAASAPGGLPPSPVALILVPASDATLRVDVALAGHGSPTVPPPARGPPATRL
jgi:hypothetical protein